MTPHEKLRALVDRVNKRAAKANPTGGDNRMGEEAMNTGAVARNQALMNKVPKPVRPMPLHELQRKGTKTVG